MANTDINVNSPSTVEWNQDQPNEGNIDNKREFVDLQTFVQNDDNPEDVLATKAGFNQIALLKAELYSVNSISTKEDAKDVAAKDANDVAISNGFDPLISSDIAESGDIEKAKAALKEAFESPAYDEYYDNQIEEVRKDPDLSPAQKRMIIRELREDKASRPSYAQDRLEKLYDAEIANGATPQEALKTASIKYNDEIRAKALQRAASEYENMTVTNEDGERIFFTVPYNWNVGDEANGFKLGKGTAREIQQHVQSLINDGTIEDASPEGIEKYCRENKIGIDCSGFSFNVRDRADQLLGGNGITDTAVNGPYNTSASVLNGDADHKGRVYSEEVSAEDLRPGDTIRFGENGHHIAIVTGIYKDAKGNTRVRVSHSNELTALGEDGDKPWGVRSGELIINKDGKMNWKGIPLVPNDFDSFWRLKENVGNENFA